MSKIVNVRTADDNNVVVTVKGAGGYRRTPCPGCPWRVANAGSFPAEAFRLSAPTAYDAAFEKFACHESGMDHPATCAGFLLRNADNNVGVRASGIDPATLVEPPERLFDSYRDMAIGNGVDADDPVLARCRDNRQ